MKTDTLMFVIAPPAEDGAHVLPGTTFAVADLPVDLRWWLVQGCVAALGVRRRAA